ncbi:MAG: transcription-repair coupling factor [Clostridia bacterium]|nr:transcription-repair coupling factor [Clostridia bacterium]
MSGFSQSIAQHDTYQEILSTIRAGRFPFGILGTTAMHKVVLLHALLESLNEAGGHRRAMVLVPDEGTATKMAEDFDAMGTRAAVLPAKDLTFLTDQVRSREYEQQRMGALSAWLLGDLDVLLVSAEAAVQKTVPPQVLAARMIRLKTGEDISLDDLRRKFVAAGYKRAEEVDGRGLFSVRGGIVDFFPPEREHPFRMELWGDTVDTIAEFDEETQRRTDLADEVLLTPCAEIIAGDGEEESAEAVAETIRQIARKVRSKQADLAKSRLQADADAILSGRDLCPEKYVNLYYENACTPLGYLQEGDLLIASESGTVKERVNGAVKLYREDVKAALEAGEYVKALGDLMVSYQDLVSDYEHADLLYMDNFARGSFDLPVRELYSLTLGQTPQWNGTFSSLEQDCLPAGVRSCTTVVAGGTEKAAKQLAEDLTDAGYRAVYFSLIPNAFPEGTISVIPGTFSAGVHFHDSKFYLITQGSRAAEKRRKRLHAKNAANAFHSLDELHKGDYVVHALHGIGVFEGIEKMTVTGVTKDYLKIQYAKGDALYVPVTQLDLVSKYIGPRDDTSRVKVNRLGSREWEKSRSKVRAAVKDMAKELTQLYATRLKTPGYAFSPDIDMQSDFERRFEYDETDDQLRCIHEIKGDMERPHPMDRLLCGDVGFGKTEVALRAAFKCIADGKQCALLVPTTILAFQHYNTILQRFDGFPVEVEMLSRFRTPTQQKKILDRVRRGNVDVLVGTHRLISKDVEFRDLGLLIVDEEQRFGVAQKEKLKQKFPNVDVLTLSATPIPRTLNMAMSGIRDMSIIEEAPQDRHPVQTFILEYDNGIVAQAIEKELRRGGQVYYLYNNVEGITHCAAKVHELVPEARIGIAHGKMSEEQLSAVWRELMEGDIDVLVCTTIIETGVDVPNVNTLIIENADRFGLSQLHQIRGRIGRSSRRATAYLTFYGGKELTDIAQRRLSAIREYTEFGSGFKIALRDLELRGAGSLLGAQQHGHMEAVGYDMYLKILAEAIEEQKAEQGGADGDASPAKPYTPQKECLVDIQIDAHIPETYIESIPHRLAMYRRIADIRTAEDAMDVTDELIDRFGDPPPAVEGLIEVALLRNTAARLGIHEITQRGDALLLWWDDIDTKAVARASREFRGRLMVSGGSKPYVTFKIEHTSVVAEQDAADTLKDLKTCLLLMAASEKEKSSS